MNEVLTFNQDIKKTCERYLAVFPQERDRLRQLLSLTERADVDLRRRSTIPEGHICASAIILSRDARSILMLEHKALGIWVVPGGHYDIEDDKPENTALREAAEESGLQGLTVHPWHQRNGDIPLDIDTHEIPDNPKKQEGKHFHFDLRYVLSTQAEFNITTDPNESVGYRWVPINEIDPTSSILLAVAKLDSLSLRA